MEYRTLDRYKPLLSEKQARRDDGEVVRRILKLRHKRETQQAFAERIGVKPQVVTHWMKGQKTIKAETLLAVVENTGEDALYLLTGKRSPARDAPARAAIEEIWEIAGRILEGRIEPTALPTNRDPVLDAKLNREADTELQRALVNETTRPRNEKRRLPKEAIGNLGS